MIFNQRKNYSLRHRFDVIENEVHHFIVVSVKYFYFCSKHDSSYFFENFILPILEKYDNIIMDFENFDCYSSIFLREVKHRIINTVEYKSGTIRIININKWEKI